MSNYVTPFLVLNLGSEMVFVVAQRLQAQNLTVDRTNLVLDEIISVLVSKQLMTELMRPQTAYSHAAVREIIEDVTQSSVMRLDPVSMGKLWDLITMVFKWQLTLSEEIVHLTLRHLYEIENYVTNPETHLQLHKVQNLIENFNKILSPKEIEVLRDDLLYWLKDSNVRVSLLLRMGLQSMDGNFITNNLEPIAEEMLRNLGENIYAVTENGKVLEKNCNKSTSHHQQPPDVNELQLFVDQMLGGRKLSSGSNDGANALRLAIDDKNGNAPEDKTKAAFDQINVVKSEENQIGDLMSDLDINNESEEGGGGGSLKDDLLEMIGGEDFV